MERERERGDLSTWVKLVQQKERNTWLPCLWILLFMRISCLNPKKLKQRRKVESTTEN